MVAAAPKFYDIERDGVTQGLLQTFMDCPEKARLFLQGWSPRETSMGLVYGIVTHHALSVIYGQIQSKKLKAVPTTEQVKTVIAQSEKQWRLEHPRASEVALQHLEVSLLMAEATLPVYFKYWARDFNRNWTGLEQTFRVPYKLRDGRVTFVRGRRDGDFLNGRDLWTFETKTKGMINEDILVDRLPFDLQNNVYWMSIRREKKQIPKGVLYNLIRRPMLRQGANESLKEFGIRCADDIRKRPEWYFIQYEIAVTKAELDKWEGEFDDLINNFARWWKGEIGHYRNPGQCETKYGRCEMLHMCAAQRLNYYEKRKVVFRELEDL